MSLVQQWLDVYAWYETIQIGATPPDSSHPVAQAIIALEREMMRIEERMTYEDRKALQQAVRDMVK